MKKISALLLTFILTLFFTLSFFPTTVFAYGATTRLNNGDRLYLPNFATSEMDRITVASGSSVTIQGAAGDDDLLYGVQISCETGCKVTLKDVDIDNFSINGSCPLSFSGTGNELILEGTSYLRSGAGQAGVQVNSGVSLIIKGNGSLHSIARNDAAGIGANGAKDGGSITIQGNANITAESLAEGSGIGGGRSGNGGTVIIKDNATVVAKGNHSGIGSSQSKSGCNLTISGGSVYAYGYYGPGIAGSRESDININITGGAVFANTARASTIPGKYGDQGDIGYSVNTSSVKISGDAAVFLAHDICYPTPTTSHRHFPSTHVKEGKIYGYDAPEKISFASAYIASTGEVYEIKYNSNGGTPETHYEIQYAGKPTILSDGTEFEREYYNVANWNTSSDGSGNTYNVGQSNIFASDTNLYAQWEPIYAESIDLRISTCWIKLGDTYTVKPFVEPEGKVDLSRIQWESSNTDIVTVSSSGVLEGKAVGSAVITATIDGKTDQFDVKSYIPLTDLDIKLGMYLGDILPLLPIFKPDDATYKDIRWKSSDESILKIDENGIVTAVGLGEASVTGGNANFKGPTYYIEVIEPNKPISSVSFLPSHIQLDVGQLHILEPHIVPYNATYDTVDWVSSDTDKADVYDGGIVSTKAPGDVTISATIGGVTGECTIEIIQPVTSIDLDDAPDTIYVGDTFVLDGSVVPDNAIHQTLIWTSSDPSVATVSQSGEITALGIGTANIRAECDGEYNVREIKVAKRPVTKITLEPSSLSLYLNEWRTLEPTVNPETATYKDVAWSTNLDSVATVDKNGTVNAVGLGECEIYATSTDDNTIIGICEVQVIAKDVASVTVIPSSKEMYLRDSFALKADVLPKDATYPDITWSSTDTAIATVDENGGVRAVGLGTCDIEAKAGGETSVCNIEVFPIDVESVSLNLSDKELRLGESFTLKATVAPKDATYPEVTWSSSDESVATVDENGGVQSVGLGTCAINAESGGKYTKCSINVVKVGITSLSLDRRSNLLYEGEWFTLTAAILPDDATYPAVTWASSDSSIAKVNEVGTVQAVSAGKCTITATADDVSTSCSVTVNKIPAVGVDSVKLAINSNTVTMLYVGDTIDLVANVYPSDADNKSLTWVSSNASVATVTSLGHVTAVGIGEAQISVTADAHSDTYNIVVNERNEDALPSPIPVPTSTPVPSDAQTAAGTEVREVTIVNFDTTTLPDGTKYILLPCGETVELTGDGIMRIEVPCEDVDENGDIEFVALNDERIPLGSVKIDAAVGNESDGLPVWAIMLIALATLIVGAGGALLFVRVVINRK